LSGAPDAHARARDDRELDGSGETLVTLGIVVLQANLKFDRLEKVSLLLLKGVVEKLLHVGAHSGDCDFRHDGQSSRRIARFLW